MGIRFWELIAIAVGLSMDAFAVSICKGLSVQKLKFRHILAAGLYFGGFQALMPTIGYFVGIQFEKYIKNYDHWIAFGLLALIGANMIREALSKNSDKKRQMPLLFPSARCLCSRPQPQSMPSPSESLLPVLT